MDAAKIALVALDHRQRDSSMTCLTSSNRVLRHSRQVRLFSNRCRVSAKRMLMFSCTYFRGGKQWHRVAEKSREGLVLFSLCLTRMAADECGVEFDCLLVPRDPACGAGTQRKGVPRDKTCASRVRLTGPRYNEPELLFFIVYRVGVRPDLEVDGGG